MKLIDLSIHKNFKNQTLKDGNFYIVLEQKDVLHPLFLKERFTLTELNDYIEKYKESFKYLTELIFGVLSDLFKINVEEDIVCYVTDTNKMSMCLRCFVLDVEDEAFFKASIEELKNALLKNDVYLKIKS